jgi:glutamine amidotransferase
MDALIVDYGMGNLRSVANALAALDCTATISKDPAQARLASKIILPGVGAFGDAMEGLRSSGWTEALEEEVRGKGKPFLGVCLGMQLLAREGREHGVHAGLGWIVGTVDRLRPADPSLKVPHVGWNALVRVNGNGLFDGVSEGSTFYFLHGYVLDGADPATVTSVCDYGGEFPASIEQGNILATQFHPEKSQKAGLQVLRNFLKVRCR